MGLSLRHRRTSVRNGPLMLVCFIRLWACCLSIGATFAKAAPLSVSWIRTVDAYCTSGRRGKIKLSRIGISSVGANGSRYSPKWWKIGDSVHPLEKFCSTTRIELQRRKSMSNNADDFDGDDVKSIKDTFMSKGIADDVDERSVIFLDDDNKTSLDHPNAVSLALLAFLGVSWIVGFVSLPIAAAATILFVLLRVIATQLIILDESIDDPTTSVERSLDDIDDPLSIPLQWKIDGTSFVLAFLTAALFVPSTWIEIWNDRQEHLDLISLFVFVVVVFAGFWFNAVIVRPVMQDEQLSEQDKILNLWDRKFLQQSKKDDIDYS
jgi:hypothetical protein